jgi:urease subunit gamma
MQLTPREKDKLLVAMAAMVARGRLQRGVKLNHPEAIALITEHVVEARGAQRGRPDGQRRPRADARPGHARHCRDDPRHPGRSDFPDGTKLVTVHKPIR